MLITRRSLMLGVAAGVALPGLPRSAAADVVNLQMADLYGKSDDFSPTAKQYAGKEVAFEGFMAPPLKPDAKFFVLANVPMAVCPFCAEAAQWPEDIVVVYTKKAIEVLPFDLKLTATGKLELGTWIDPDTGFVSRVRLMSAEYKGKPTVTRAGQGPTRFFFGN